MHTMGLFRSWSAFHLKASYWYLDYGKTFFLEGEEDVKSTLAQDEPRHAESKSNNGND